MPNWCTNIVEIQFPSVDAKQAFLNKIKSNEKSQEEAIERALKVVLASLLGVIAPARGVPDTLSQLNSDRIGKAVAGFPSVANKPTPQSEALSDLLELLAKNPDMTDDVIKQVNELFERTGVHQIPYQSLSAEQQGLIGEIMEHIGYDFGVNVFALKSTPVEAWWDNLGRNANTEGDDPNGYLDYTKFVRRSLLAQVSGYNRSIWNNHSAYDDCVRTFGVKWNSFDKWGEISTDINDTGVRFEIQTPWTAPVPVINAIMSEFSASGSLIAYEPGCAFAIQAVYSEGELIEYSEDELQYADPENDDYEILWPPYVAGIEA